MFQQRLSKKSPADELLVSFSKQFPEARVVKSTASIATQDYSWNPTLWDANAIAPSTRLDTSLNSSSLHSRGPAILFHHQAGDLHTPTLGLGLGLRTTPLLPTVGRRLHSGTSPEKTTGFNASRDEQDQDFGTVNEFSSLQNYYAGSSFTSQDVAHETAQTHASQIVLEDFNGQTMSFPKHLYTRSATSPSPQNLKECLRYQCTIDAPPIIQSGQDQVTYLNKGPTYTLSIFDTNSSASTTYQTTVCVSFDDEKQRRHADHHWNLWKEKARANEACQLSRKLQAIEFIGSEKTTEDSDTQTFIKRGLFSLDGFSVRWAPALNGAPKINFLVRFNFLSTDFTHTKGVEGNAVRLQVRTCALQTNPPIPTSSLTAEVYFCKIKLFRDHGTE